MFNFYCFFFTSLALPGGDTDLPDGVELLSAFSRVDIVTIVHCQSNSSRQRKLRRGCRVVHVWGLWACSRQRYERYNAVGVRYWQSATTTRIRLL